MNIQSIVLGIATGIVLAYIIFYLINKSKNVSKASFNNLTQNYRQMLNKVEKIWMPTNTWKSCPLKVMR